MKGYAKSVPDLYTVDELAAYFESHGKPTIKALDAALSHVGKACARELVTRLDVSGLLTQPAAHYYCQSAWDDWSPGPAEPAERDQHDESTSPRLPGGFDLDDLVLDLPGFGRPVVGMLTANQREVLAMRLRHNLPFSEIGRYLGVSRQAVHRTYNRTLSTLHRHCVDTGTPRGRG